MPLKRFVFVIKPLHHFGAWIRAIVRDFDDPSHLCKRQSNSLRFQDEVNVAHDFGSKDVIPVWVRFALGSNPIRSQYRSVFDVIPVLFARAEMLSACLMVRLGIP